jgi:peptidyl-prolyl cis-trans isomerase SurA
MGDTMRKVAIVLTLFAAAAAAQEKGKTVEEIVARVNNEIITRSEYERARDQAADEARQDCPGCTAEQVQSVIAEKLKNVLRDLIDQSLLVQRGKDMGISVETDVIKRLDQVRIQNKLESMEDLEKAVSAQGLNFEEFKSNIRNGLLTQKVVGSEVGPKIQIAANEIAKYYEAHQKEFVRPEQVAIREIFLSTEGKKDAEIAELKKKVAGFIERVQNGEDFAELAKRFSEGTTAKQGGYLGMFKRGELAKELEEKTFALKKNGLTDVIQTKQGFLALQVLEHYAEGEQPLPKVENEIRERLYNERMGPALRDYLKTLREQSYVIVKAGYVDTAGIGTAPIQEVTATPESDKSKKGRGRKKFLLFGKHKESGE